MYSQSAFDACQLAAKTAWSKGASDPVALDVSQRLALTDIFLIVSGRNERNVQAIADAVEEELHLVGHKVLRREGKQGGRWILLDFGDLIVHVFHEEERAFYQLERLWKDCPVVAVEVPVVASPEEQV